MEPASASLRHVQLAAAVLGLVLVIIFGPRMEGPRVMCGMEFKSKSGGPGLTNLGFLLLVIVPVTAYFAVGLAGRWVSSKTTPPD